MPIKLFGVNISPACEYCELGRLTADSQRVLCNRSGAVSLDFKCRKFKYDPLKRIPKSKKALTNYAKEDFSL